MLWILSVLLVGLARASTFQTVCQAASDNAPQLQFCKNAPSQIAAKYGGNNITQGGAYDSCTVIWSYGDCQVDLCSTNVYESINTTLVANAVSSIINGCQNQQSGRTYNGGYVNYTGGYTIVQGTNFTVGVVGNDLTHYLLPDCDASSTYGTTGKNCQAALKSLNTSGLITQADSSGCSITATSGNCTLNYCAPKGSVLSVKEYSHYMSYVFGYCDDANTDLASGRLVIDPVSSVGMYNPIKPLPVINTAVTCGVGATIGYPKFGDCVQASSNLFNGSSATTLYKQPLKNSECTLLSSYGTCRLSLCGPGNSSVTQSQLSDALGQVRNTCSQQAGHARIANSDTTVVVATTNVQNSTWCNTAPNNSPKSKDCADLVNSLDTSRLYTQQNSGGSSQNCQLIKKSGTCFLNFCAPPNVTIPGTTLKSYAQSILNGCSDGTYASGIHQLNAYTSVSLYDPPATVYDVWSDPVCTNSNDHPDYSAPYSDCIDAINNGIAANGGAINHGSDTATNGCTSPWVSGSCGIAICGAFLQIQAPLLQEAALGILTYCSTNPPNSNNVYAAGQFPASDPYIGNWGVVLYNHGYQNNGPGDDGWVHDETKKRSLIDDAPPPPIKGGPIAPARNTSAPDLSPIHKRAMDPRGNVPGTNYYWTSIILTSAAAAPQGYSIGDMTNTLAASIGNNLNVALGTSIAGAVSWKARIATFSMVQGNPTSLTPAISSVLGQASGAAASTLVNYWSQLGAYNFVGMELRNSDGQGNAVGDPIAYGFVTSGSSSPPQ